MIYLLATNNPNKAREIRPMFEAAGLELITLPDLGLHYEAGEDGKTFAANATQKAVETADFIRKQALCAKNNVTLAVLTKGSKQKSLLSKLTKPGEDCNPSLRAERSNPSLDCFVASLLATTGGNPSSKLTKPDNLLAYDNIAVLADDSGLVIDTLGGEPGVDSALYMGRDTPYDVKCENLLGRLAAMPHDKRTARFVCSLVCVRPDGSQLVAEGTVEGRIAFAPSGSGGFGYDPIFYYPPYGKTLAELTQDEKNNISHRGQAIQKMIGLIVNEGIGTK